MAQAVAAQAFARAAALVPDGRPRIDVPRARRTGDPGAPADERRGGSVDPPLLVPVDRGAERAAAGRDLARDVRGRLGGPGRRSARGRISARPRRRWRASTPATGRTTRCRATPRDLDYQHYVVQLLNKLAPTDPRFADASKRFAAYEKQPPAFKLATGGSRPGALLALEAVERRGHVGGRAVATALPRRRLAHARLAGRSGRGSTPSS